MKGTYLFQMGCLRRDRTWGMFREMGRDKKTGSPAIAHHEDVAADLAVEDTGEGYAVAKVATVAVEHDHRRARRCKLASTNARPAATLSTRVAGAKKKSKHALRRPSRPP